MTPLVLCLALWADPGMADAAQPSPMAAAVLPVTAFTLAWTHSIERVRWEEDYRAELIGGQPVLVATEARIKGSAAGMEPPEQARWRDGWYTYTPAGGPVPRLLLSRSAHTADYELCTHRGCTPLGHWLGPAEGTVTVQPCLDVDKAAPSPGINRPQAPESSG